MTARKPTRQQNDAAELLPSNDAAEKITAFFDSIGGDKSASVSIYAVDPNNRTRRSFLFTLPDVRELTGPELMAQVLKEYGPGEYMADSRNDEGQIAFQSRFEVGAMGRKPFAIPGPVVPPAPASRPGDISAELVAMMARQTAALETLANQRQPSMLGMLKEMKELRDVLAPAPAAQFDFGKVLELVTGVIDLRDKLGDAGGNGESSPLSVLARSLAPALTRIAERAVDTPALPAPRPAAGAGGDQVTVTPPAVAPAEVADVGASNVMLKVYVRELVGFAEQGLEPQAAADRVLQTLAGFPEPMVAAIVDWLNDEDVVKNLAEIEPKAAQYGAWLTEVVDRVLDAALEADDTPPSPEANGTRTAAAG